MGINSKHHGHIDKMAFCGFGHLASPIGNGKGVDQLATLAPDILIGSGADAEWNSTLILLSSQFAHMKQSCIIGVTLLTKLADAKYVKESIIRHEYNLT